ncbi:MAG: RDD family protein [Dehalococcoidia bacterium]
MECTACGSKMRDEARVCLSCGEVVRKKVAPADRLEVAPAGVPHWIALDTSPRREVVLGAGRPARALALIFDATVLGLLGWALVAAIGGTSMRVTTEGEYHIDWWVAGPLLAIQTAYFVIFPATKWQGTPGKRLVSLRIVDLDENPINIIQSLVRYVFQQIWLVVGVPLTVLGVSFSPWALFPFVAVIAVGVAFWMLCNNGRSPWDWMAGTKVVE